MVSPGPWPVGPLLILRVGLTALLTVAIWIALVAFATALTLGVGHPLLFTHSITLGAQLSLLKPGNWLPPFVVHTPLVIRRASQTVAI